MDRSDGLKRYKDCKEFLKKVLGDASAADEVVKSLQKKRSEDSHTLQSGGYAIQVFNLSVLGRGPNPSELYIGEVSGLARDGNKEFHAYKDRNIAMLVIKSGSDGKKA